MLERDIFLAATEIPSADARKAYLDKACAGNPLLREKVDALLESDSNAGTFLSTPLIAPNSPVFADTRDFDPNDPQAGALEDSLAFLKPPKRPDSLGRLGHYEMLQVLGRGAFGIVFRAFDNILQRVVAVKVMAPLLATTSPARKRFLREARSSAQIRHENVVQVYEVGEAPLPHLVMEFIPGETLQAKLDRLGPVDALEVVRIGRQIAEGLVAAHAVDLIHRDIKPGNILLEGGTNKVKLTDFGLARTADDASLSQSGVVAGTPMYMAPEQAQGETLDQRADLFSLGSVLYQMVTGRPPFRANTTLAVLKRVAEDNPRPIREIIPETPAWLIDIITKLHAKNVEDRYQTAREVADLLGHCEAQLKVNAKVAPAVPPRATPPTRLRQWVVAATLLLVPFLALAGYALTRPTPKTVVDPPLAQLPPDEQPKSPSQSKDTPQPVSKKVADFDWQRVAALPVAEQVETVKRELQTRNPSFDGMLQVTIENNIVTRVELPTAMITDIAPLRAFANLKALHCPGMDGAGVLTDLTPLRGLSLTVLDLNNNGDLADLSPVQDMPLQELYVQRTALRDLDATSKMKLVHLNCSLTRVSDLRPLKGMPLVTLYLDGTRVTDLAPLHGAPLKILNVRTLMLNAERVQPVIQSLTQLESVNSLIPSEFLKELPATTDK